MAMTQMQLIQSLGEALAWFEREINWGVPAGKLTHLCGRIGELYVAMITNGQMAPEVNQRGYDVVSSDGERISVKTTTMMSDSGHVSFNGNTLNSVDRVIILRINSEEMQVEILLDEPVSEAIEKMREAGGSKKQINLGVLNRRTRPNSELEVTNEIEFQEYKIRELESGTIEVIKDGAVISPTKPELRQIAAELNISVLNSNNNEFNTRQLGSHLIKSLQQLRKP